MVILSLGDLESGPARLPSPKNSSPSSSGLGGVADESPSAKSSPQPVAPQQLRHEFAKRRSMSMLSSLSETHVKAYHTRKSFTRPKNWVLIFGWFLASCAGFVNTVAFLHWHMFVSHMTGTSTKIGMQIEGYDNGENDSSGIFKEVGLVLCFVTGATMCGLLIDKNQVHFGGKSMYGLALVINGLALVTATLLPDMPTVSGFLAAMACGLQNAMCTSHFGAVVRTTHVTGTLTDVGSILGRILLIYIRKGCRPSRLNVLEKAEIGVDLRKLLVLLPMWISFVTGATMGAFAERTLGKQAMFIPALATTFLGLLYMTCRQVLKDFFKSLDKESLQEKLREVQTAMERAGTRIVQSGGSCEDVAEIDQEIGDLVQTLEEVETSAVQA